MFFYLFSLLELNLIVTLQTRLPLYLLGALNILCFQCSFGALPDL